MGRLMILIGILVVQAAAFISIEPGQKMLFVGNSYTGYADIVLNQRFVDIFSKSQPSRTLQADISWQGGKTLFWHWSDKESTTRQRIESGTYDVVVLQAYTDAIDNVARFDSTVGLFVKLVTQKNGRVVLYHPQHRYAGATQDNAKVKVLHNTFDTIGKKYNIPVVHAGSYLNYLVDNYPAIDWFIPGDIRHHYDQPGAVAATVFFYCAFSGKNPLGHPYHDKQPQNVMDIIQRTAWQCINQYPPYAHLGDTSGTDSVTIPDTLPNPDDTSATTLPTFLKSLTPAAYEFDPAFTQGADIYTDRTYSATALNFTPSRGEWVFIRTANGDKASTSPATVGFVLEANARVYVGIVNEETLPAWLEGDWQKSTMTLSASQGKTYTLYGRDFNAGAVNLGGREGGSGTNNYVLFVQKKMVTGTHPSPYSRQGSALRGTRTSLRTVGLGTNTVHGRGYTLQGRAAPAQAPNLPPGILVLPSRQ